jgi:hypothetical protein
MKNPNFLIQVLSILTITLCLVFFIIYKILSRFKNQTKGNPDGGKLADFKLSAPKKMPVVERLKLKCPSLIERPQGFTKVGIKEISINGAFVTCPRPFPIGETFQIKIFFEAEKSLALKADVLWNNNNVPSDQIVARGMKVRFLQLSGAERQILNEIVSKIQPGLLLVNLL